MQYEAMSHDFKKQAILCHAKKLKFFYDHILPYTTFSQKGDLHNTNLDRVNCVYILSQIFENRDGVICFGRKRFVYDLLHLLY